VRRARRRGTELDQELIDGFRTNGRIAPTHLALGAITTPVPQGEREDFDLLRVES